MSHTARFARMLDASMKEQSREHDPTFRMEQHVANARREMGEARWNELNAEWDESASLGVDPAILTTEARAA